MEAEPREELPQTSLATWRGQERLLSLPSHVHPQKGREICNSWAVSGALRGTGRILIALCSFGLDICVLIKTCSPSSEAALPGVRKMHK